MLIGPFVLVFTCLCTSYRIMVMGSVWAAAAADAAGEAE